MLPTFVFAVVPFGVLGVLEADTLTLKIQHTSLYKYNNNF